MSCGLLRSAPSELPEDIARVDEPARFYVELANGLHAMAQPLTILRGALGALTFRDAAAIDRGHYHDMSTRQVERMCELMSRMQHLLIARQFEPVCSKTELWDLLAPILEAQESVARELGVSIKVARPHQAIALFVDAERTEQALQFALEVAASVSSPGEVIHFSVVPRDGFAEVILQNGNCHGKRLSSFDRLSLSVVEENIRSQQGRYEFAEDPFRILLALPGIASADHQAIARRDRPESGVRGSC
jgi:hypothetical protein